MDKKLNNCDISSRHKRRLAQKETEIDYFLPESSSSSVTNFGPLGECIKKCRIENDQSSSVSTISSSSSDQLLNFSDNNNEEEYSDEVHNTEVVTDENFIDIKKREKMQPLSIDYDNSSDDADDMDIDDKSMDNELLCNLRNWSFEFKIKHNAINALMEILRNAPHSQFKNLPKDARVLLKTPKKTTEIVALAGGWYYHFGLSNTLEVFLQHYKIFCVVLCLLVAGKRSSISQMATLRWGIAGTRMILDDFVIALHSLPTEEHEIIAVAAQQQLSRAQDFASRHKIKEAYDDYEKLALNKDIDIVFIGAINPQHFDIGMLMLKHGKHVLCQKPLTLNLKQATELIDYARSEKLFLMEAVWNCCFPAYDAIRKELATDNVGDIHQVIVSLGYQISNVDQILRKEFGGGSILDLGIYCLQFVCLAYGNELPESIKASGVVNKNGVDLSMSATLLYKGNRTATITTQALVTLSNDGYICGTKGMIKMPSFSCPTSVELPDDTFNFSLPKLSRNTSILNGAGFCYLIAEVRACILKGLIESSKVTHKTSILLANLEDELRRQLGVVFPEDA